MMQSEPQRGIPAIEARPERVILGEERGKKKYSLKDARATSGSLLMAIGAAFAISGFVELALLWAPLRFGSAGWAFGTLSQTFSAVPLTGLGLVLVVYGLIDHPRGGGRWMWVGAGLFAVLSLMLLAMGILYATVVPAVMRRTPTEELDAVGRAVARNGVEIVVYTAVFAILAFVLWQSIWRDELS